MPEPARFPGPFLAGVIHLRPLPGSPGWEGDPDAVIRAAVADARAYYDGGMDALVIENFGDLPFFPDRVPPETVAAMARAAVAVRGDLGDADFPIGFNVLRNDAASAPGLAAACGGAFVRVNVLCGAMVTDQGLIEGRAAEVLRKRRELCPGTRLFADVLVKHATPAAPVSIAQAARDTWHRGGADGLIVTGDGTGRETAFDDLRAVREAVPGAFLLAGSGVTAESLPALLEIADGAIVGTSLKRGGDLAAPVDPARVAALVRAAGKTPRTQQG